MGVNVGGYQMAQYSTIVITNKYLLHFGCGLVIQLVKERKRRSYL